MNPFFYFRIEVRLFASLFRKIPCFLLPFFSFVRNRRDVIVMGLFKTMKGVVYFKIFSATSSTFRTSLKSGSIDLRGVVTLDKYPALEFFNLTLSRASSG